MKPLDLGFRLLSCRPLCSCLEESSLSQRPLWSPHAPVPLSWRESPALIAHRTSEANAHRYFPAESQNNSQRRFNLSDSDPPRVFAWYLHFAPDPSSTNTPSSAALDQAPEALGPSTQLHSISSSQDPAFSLRNVVGPNDQEGYSQIGCHWHIAPFLIYASLLKLMFNLGFMHQYL